MGRSEAPLTRLGRRLAGEQDELLRGRPPDPRERARFLDAAELPAPRPRILAAPILAAAAALVAAMIWLSLGRRPLQFQVGSGDAAHAGAPGAWVATDRDEVTPLRFSDGTSFEIQPESKVRVASVEPEGGRIVLESGAVKASVKHREGTRWLLDSGPYEVLVTGTRFDVSWDLGAEELAVDLDEGSVSVSGPIVGAGLAVRAGDTLRVHGKEKRFELRGNGREAKVAAPQLEVAPAESSGEPAAPPPPPIATSPPSAPPARALAPPRDAPRPSWRELAARGRYKEALEAADREGFHRICEEGSAADLRAIGDAARLSDDVGRAALVLTTLRRRFPGDEQAAEAAFLLGILAFDKQVAYAEAARWFKIYAAERPGGRLSREAAGRLMEALDRSGDKAGAREIARRYLRDHPGGPHAEMARTIAGE